MMTRIMAEPVAKSITRQSTHLIVTGPGPVTLAD